MISNRCHYALRAMLELALREGRGSATIAEIAAAQRIPARFLEAIMRQLKQAGLADSVRGKEGGYFIARPASTVHVGDVLAIFDGPFFSHREQRGPQVIREESQDLLDPIWNEAETALVKVFAKHTFSALAEREQRRRFETASNYAI